MRFKYFDIILGLFVAVLLISNIASTKILNFGPFTFDGGTILFPIIYIFGDILTEVYGYKAARRVIWTGFAGALLMSVVLIIVGKLPAAADWVNQEAYDAILGLTPRIVVASLIAYFAGEFSNSVTLAKMKVWTKGRHLWSRTIGSTIIGEGIDTVLFVLIAFVGVLPGSLVITIIVSNYIFKVGFEALATPFTYLFVNKLKKKEGIDAYDTDTKFNPFSFKS
ncbi:queuosine precursor transporter [Patescibacteria group bacterium]|nr:queuosine precursor transporter [Patescibacteria group bacterium]MBU0963495.1 queuosine precursor transporter [Patescibacteria group bacterium]